MRNQSSRILVSSVVLSLAACSSARAPGPEPVVIRYQHVANAQEVRFAAPLQFAPYPASYVLPRNPQGFWAIFVLCSLDASAAAAENFIYDVGNFRIEYDGGPVGALAPYSLRYEDSPYLNGPADTPVLANAIAAELQRGPSLQVFPKGEYPALNYRIALFVPRSLDDYAGEQLSLSYRGQSVRLVGNGYPPYFIPAVGGSGAGVASRCLP